MVKRITSQLLLYAISRFIGKEEGGMEFGARHALGDVKKTINSNLVQDDTKGEGL